MSYSDRETRKAVELEVQLKDFKFTEISAENAANLSSGGAFIKMETPHNVGTLMKFEMIVDDNKSINGVARVVWLREEADNKGPSGIGIKFVKLGPSSQALLTEVLKKAEEAPSAPPPDPSPSDSIPAPKRTSTPAASKSVPPSKRISKPAAAKSDPAPKRVSKPAAAKSDPAPKRVSKPAPEPETEAPEKTTPQPESKSKPAPEPEPEIKPEQDSAPRPEPKSEPAKTSPALVMSDEMIDPQSDAPSQAPKPSSSSPLLYIILIGAVVAGVALFMMKGNKSDSGDGAETSSNTAQTPPADEPPPPAMPQKTDTETPADTTDESPTEAAAVDAGQRSDTDADGTDDAKQVEAAADTPEPTPTASGEAVIHLKSSPEGATVMVNGTVQEGVTPLTIANVAQNKELELTLKSEGYMTTTSTYVPEEAENTLEVKLPAARIKFRLSSKPAGARILIDGKYNGKTPFTFLRRKYKPDYTYKLEKRGFKDIEGTVAPDQWVEEDGRYYVFELDAEMERKE